MRVLTNQQLSFELLHTFGGGKGLFFCEVWAIVAVYRLD
jgi:hypothetical protein